MSEIEWSDTIPELSDVFESNEVYYWVRGGNFNRTVIVKVTGGVTSEMLKGKRVFRAEVNFTFPSELYPPHIWKDDLKIWPGLNDLQWMGPIIPPK